MPEEKYEMNELEKTIVDRLKREPETFAWTPNLRTPPLTRDQLIEAIKTGKKIGKDYVSMIVAGTMSRLKRES